MAATLNLPVHLRLVIKRTPWLYRPAKRLMDRRAEGLLCDRTSDLCIEGYPSSGNSFAFAALRHTNGSLRIAHHCHSVANLKIALEYGVPAVCLIRHPESAISSRLARFEADLDDAVREYVDFYRFTLEHADRLIIVTFEELTRSTRGFLERLVRETGLALSLDDIEGLEERAMRGIREWHERHGRPEGIPLPLADREDGKARNRARIRNCRHYPEAIAIWQRVAQ